MFENKRRKQVSSYLKKTVIALGIAGLLFLLSLFPSLGYFGDVQTSVKYRSPFGFWLVDAKCNMTFNPVVYSLSWLRFQGVFSNYAFSFTSYPTYTGGEMSGPVSRTSADLNDEAILRLVLSQIYIDFVYNFLLLLVIELASLRSLYFCFIGGILGFPIGGIFGVPIGASVGALVGFLSGILVIKYMIPRLKKEHALGEWWNSLWETGEVKLK